MRLRWLVTPVSLATLGAVTWVTVGGVAGFHGTLGLLPGAIHLQALLIFLAELLCRGGRLTLLARGVARPLGLVGACATQLVGEAAAAVTPSRSGSDPARLLALRRLGVDLPGGGAMMVGEMVVEAVALAVAVLLLVLLVPGIGIPTAGIALYVVGSLTVATGIVGLAAGGGRRRLPRVLRWLGLGRRGWTWIRAGARRFRREVRELSRASRSLAAGAVGLSIARVALRLSFLPLLVAPFAPDAHLGPLVEWPLLLLYTMSVLPPPGGGGSVELGFSVGLASTLPAGALAGILVWWRVYTFYLGAVLGGLILALSRVRLPRPASARIHREETAPG